MEGIFYFENDKLAGFIEPEEIKFYLILKGKLKGGIINVPLEDNPNQFIVYEIQGCQTDFEFKTGNNPLLITKVSIKTSIGIQPRDFIPAVFRSGLSKNARNMVKPRIGAFFCQN
jgi:spore germination protein KC